MHLAYHVAALDAPLTAGSLENIRRECRLGCSPVGI